MPVSGSVRDSSASSLVRSATLSSRLRAYWIAWETPEEDARGESFLRIEVEGHGGVRAEPKMVTFRHSRYSLKMRNP